MSDAARLRPDLSVVVPWRDEALNIRRSLESVAGWCPIFVVDSGSTHRTLEICQESTEQVTHPTCTTHAAQWRWALDHLPPAGERIVALDADFVASDTLRAEIEQRLPALEPDVFRLIADWKLLALRRRHRAPADLLALGDRVVTTRDGSVAALIWRLRGGPTT